MKKIEIDILDGNYENGHAPPVEEFREAFRKRLYGNENENMLKNDNNPSQSTMKNSESHLNDKLMIKDGGHGASGISIMQKIIEKVNENKMLSNQESQPMNELKVNETQISTKIFDDKCSDQGWIQVYSGQKFFPLAPKEESIHLSDIAHSLAMICRFTGHVKQFYSVAQHSVITSYLCDEKDQKHALLHDSSEFALSDLSSPLKRSGKFENYKEYEKVLQSAIYRKFGLSEVEPASVKNADMRALATEAESLFNVKHRDWVLPCSAAPFKIEPLLPEAAEKLFLDRFKELFGQELYDWAMNG